MIKCNINPTTREKIYHLPFDQQYDRARLSRHGECYVGSVKKLRAVVFDVLGDTIFKQHKEIPAAMAF